MRALRNSSQSAHHRRLAQAARILLIAGTVGITGLASAPASAHNYYGQRPYYQQPPAYYYQPPPPVYYRPPPPVYYRPPPAYYQPPPPFYSPPRYGFYGR